MLLTLLSSIALSSSSIEITESQNTLLFEKKENEGNRLKSRCHKQLMFAIFASVLAMIGQEIILIENLGSCDPNNKQLRTKLCVIKWITEHLLNYAYVSVTAGTINSLLLRFYPSWTASDFDFIDNLGCVALSLLEYNTFSNHVADFSLQRRL